MNERQKVTEVLQAFAARLYKASKEGREITLDWQACGVLWSYLDPAVEMLKADNTPSVNSADGAAGQGVVEGSGNPSTRQFQLPSVESTP